MTDASAHAAQERLEWLFRLQNADGGWPYHAGRKSWVEPTAYALLAIGGADPGSSACKRACEYLISLQNSNGSWPASADVRESHWSTSLCISAGLKFDWPAEQVRAGVNWLLHQFGSESGFTGRLGHWLDPGAVEYDPHWRGWGWTPRTSAWIEPTSHAVLALSAAREFGPRSLIDDRLDSATRLLLDRRCPDGGWNYGNRRVRGMDLPGYPQTTGVALLALRGESRAALEISLKRALAMHAETDSALGRVWLAHGLRTHGESIDYEPPAASSDVITTSLEALWLMGKEPA